MTSFRCLFASVARTNSQSQRDKLFIFILQNDFDWFIATINESLNRITIFRISNKKSTSVNEFIGENWRFYYENIEQNTIKILSFVQWCFFKNWWKRFVTNRQRHLLAHTQYSDKNVRMTLFRVNWYAVLLISMWERNDATIWKIRTISVNIRFKWKKNLIRKKTA